MFEVAGLVAPLFSLIILGYLAGRLAKLPIQGLAWLNFFVIYIALPAMFFQYLSKIPIAEFAAFKFITVTTSTTLYVFVLCFAIALLRSRRKIGEAAIQGFAGAYGNIGYMGPPLAIAAFGPTAIVPAALIFVFDNTMHFILAPAIMAMRDSKQHSIFRLIGKILKNILTHPFIIATIIGISAAAINFKSPEPVDKILSMLAGAAAPCALFTMGVTAALRPLKRVPIELTWLVPAKLILHPALIYIMLEIFGPFDPIFTKTAIIIAALPAATNVFILAQQYDTWQERASSAVVVSTLLSMITVTVTLYFLR